MWRIWTLLCWFRFFGDRFFLWGIILFASTHTYTHTYIYDSVLMWLGRRRRVAKKEEITLRFPIITKVRSDSSRFVGCCCAGRCCAIVVHPYAAPCMSYAGKSGAPNNIRGAQYNDICMVRVGVGRKEGTHHTGGKEKNRGCLFGLCVCAAHHPTQQPYIFIHTPPLCTRDTAQRQPQQKGKEDIIR